MPIDDRFLLNYPTGEYFLFSAVNPLGRVPETDAISTAGLDREPDLETLLSIDPRGWLTEMDKIETHLESFEPRVPDALRQRLKVVREKLR